MDKTSSTTPPAESIQNRIAELRRRAAEDPLSGLLNRGALEQSIAKRLPDPPKRKDRM